MVKIHKNGISLVEVLIAIAILSTMALPMGMFIVEYAKGSSQIGDYYQILNLVEQKMEIALTMPFNEIPQGKTADKLIKNLNGQNLDLRPAQVAKTLVNFEMNSATFPVEFAAVKYANTGQLQRVRVEKGMKKIEIIARWGKKATHNLNLIAYKANL